MAKDEQQSTPAETDLEREIKKALRIAHEVERWKWLSGVTPMPTLPPRVPPQKAPAAELSGSPISSKAWVIGEAGRMKKGGEIPDGISKTDFAKVLAMRMRKAAETNRAITPIGWESMRNQLEKPFGIWPIARIST